VSDSPASEEALPAPRAVQVKAATPKRERALIRAVKRGSMTALDALVAGHWDGTHRAAFLIVQDAGIAEDIAQEAIVATVGALDRFDWRRPLRPYLHRIVVKSFPRLAPRAQVEAGSELGGRWPAARRGRVRPGRI